MSDSLLATGDFVEGRMWLVRVPPRVKNALDVAKRGEEIGVISEMIVADTAVAGRGNITNKQTTTPAAPTLRLKISNLKDVAECVSR
jgi:hypothetical protein